MALIDIVPCSNGGPAFPDAAYLSRYGGGISVRDYFAAKALGVLSSSNMNATGTFASQEGRAAVASACYHMADAMLKERAK